MSLFRAGHDEAFRVIYDRYHKRLQSYARHILSDNQDAEEALQDVFVRAYRALRADDRELAVKAWLFRIVHNRCIDGLRRVSPPPAEELRVQHSVGSDPAARLDSREALRRLIEDIRRLPEQQRSALLLRELSGISYAEVASVLDTTVPAVKSLLVRARMGLIRASTARDTGCAEIREQLVAAHEQGVRAGSSVRGHLRDCSACRSYRREIFLVRKRLSALAPVGPLAGLVKLVGIPGGGAASGGGGAVPAAAVGTGGAATGALGTGHLAALLAAAIASTGGAVGLQHMIAAGGSHHGRPAVHRAHHAAAASRGGLAPGGSLTTGRQPAPASQQHSYQSAGAPVSYPQAAHFTSSVGSSSSTRSRSARDQGIPTDRLEVSGPPLLHPSTGDVGGVTPGTGAGYDPHPVVTGGPPPPMPTGSASGSTSVSTSTGSASDGSSGTASTSTSTGSSGSASTPTSGSTAGGTGSEGTTGTSLGSPSSEGTGTASSPDGSTPADSSSSATSTPSTSS